MTPEQRTALLATPYTIDGREIGVGMNCLATVQFVTAARGLPPPDGWASIADAIKTGRVDTLGGFPPGWKRQQPGTAMRDGDVLVWYGTPEHHPGCAVVDDGYVIRSSARIGRACATPVSRWTRHRTDELWRYEP